MLGIKAFSKNIFKLVIKKKLTLEIPRKMTHEVHTKKCIKSTQKLERPDKKIIENMKVATLHACLELEPKHCEYLVPHQKFKNEFIYSKYYLKNDTF